MHRALSAPTGAQPHHDVSSRHAVLSRFAAAIVAMALAAPLSALIPATVAAAGTTPSQVALSDWPEGTSEVGTTVYYDAVITPLPSAMDSGTVTFTDGGSPIAGCSDVAVILNTNIFTNVTTAAASCQLTYDTAGDHSVQASFSGTSTLDVSVSSIVTHTVTAAAKTASTTTLSDWPEGTSEVGTTVYYDAVITPLPSAMDSGTVTFTDGGSPIAGCSDVAVILNTNIFTNVTTAAASCQLTYDTAGDHSVQASFSGTSTLDASVSAIVTHTVTAAVVIGNPSFEDTTSIAPWVLDGPGGVWNGNVPNGMGGTVAPVDGDHAFYGGKSDATGTLSQTFTPAPGAYQISFWMMGGDAELKLSHLEATLSGLDPSANRGSDSLAFGPPGSGGYATQWHQWSGEFVATGDPLTATFTFWDPVDYFYVDEVTITPAAVPDAPTDMAVANAYPGSKVHVSWTRPDVDGGAWITGYNLYMGTSAGGEDYASPVNGTTLIPADYYVDRYVPVTAGQTYYFTVKAVNGVGESIASDEVSVLATGVPSAPTNVTATALDYDKIVLSWGPPASNGGLDLNGYVVYLGTSLDNLQSLGYEDPSSTTHTFTWLDSGQAYYVGVRAQNGWGQGAVSDVVKVTTNAKASPTVTISGPTSSNVLDQATFTVTVAPNPGGGWVQVLQDEGGLCGGPLEADGTYTCTSYFWSTGTFQITATFGGYGDWGPATSAPIQFKVVQPTYTNLSWNPHPATPGPVTLVAEVYPNPGGGTVAFTDAQGTALEGCGAVSVDPDSGQATCPVTYAQPGEYKVNVAFSGFGDYPTSQGSETVSVVITTTTLVTQSTASSAIGEAVTYTATVTAADGSTVPGSIGFYDYSFDPIGACGDVPLIAGSATCSVTYDTPGTYKVMAWFNGSGVYDYSYMYPGIEHVVLAIVPTTTTLSADPASPYVGDTIVLSAQVAPTSGALDGGTVSFADANQTTLCDSEVDTATGLATCSVSYKDPASVSITASYSGTSAYGTSSSEPLALDVLPFIQTSTTVTSSATTVIVGQPVTYTASVAPDPLGGSVQFFADGTPITGCQVPVIHGSNAGVATCTTSLAPVGSHQITAAFSPAPGMHYKGSTSPALREQVTYAVNVLTPNQSVVAGSKITFQIQLTDFAGNDLSASGITITVAGVRPPWGGPAVDGTMTFVPASAKKPAYYSYTLSVPTTVTARTYRLAFTATGDPVTHQDISFTVTPKKK